MEISGYKNNGQLISNCFHIKYKNIRNPNNVVNFAESFQEIYNLFSVDIDLFCKKVDEFTKYISETQEFYFPVDEKSMEMINFLTFLLSCEAPPETLNVSISLIQALFSFNGVIGAYFLRTQLIEIIVELIQRTRKSNILCNSLTILSSAIGCSEKCNEKGLTRNDTLKRIFNNISLDDLKNKSFINEESGKAFLLFLYSVLKENVDSDFQTEILCILDNIYENGQEIFYWNASWILFRLTNFKDNFPFDVFIQSCLPGFLNDALYNEKCSYQALASIENIYDYWKPNDIFKNCYEEILKIGFNEKSKNGIREAAFSTINAILKKDLDFFKYFSDNLCWKECIKCYSNVTFGVKPKITLVLLTYQQYCDFLELQNLVENGYISLLNDSIEIDFQDLGKPAIIGLRYLVEEFTKNQWGGYFEMKAIQELNIDKIDEIIDEPGNSDISKDAIILQSLLYNLPNGVIKKQRM